MILGNIILLKVIVLILDLNVCNFFCCLVEWVGNKDIGSYCFDLNLNVNEFNN